MSQDFCVAAVTLVQLRSIFLWRGQKRVIMSCSAFPAVSLCVGSTRRASSPSHSPVFIWFLQETSIMTFDPYHFLWKHSWQPKVCLPHTVMTLSSLLRITPRLTPTAARRTTRAVSSATNTPNTKSLDSILIANRGEIALYVLPGNFSGLVLLTAC